MTSTEFAEKLDVPYNTVARWLRQGKIEGAFSQTFGKLTLWMIPIVAIKDFERPKLGRPAKKKATSKVSKKPAAKKGRTK